MQATKCGQKTNIQPTGKLILQKYNCYISRDLGQLQQQGVNVLNSLHCYLVHMGTFIVFLCKEEELPFQVLYLLYPLFLKHQPFAQIQNNGVIKSDSTFISSLTFKCSSMLHNDSSKSSGDKKKDRNGKILTVSASIQFEHSIFQNDFLGCTQFKFSANLRILFNNIAQKLIF